MADTHETIADIIAEMRRNFADGNPYYAAGLPDRLEAAHKRDTKELRVEIERLKEERNYSGVRERERLRANGFAIVPKEQLERGNAAKLREALEAIISGYENADLCDTNYREWCHNPENVCVNVLLCKAIHEARAALAAPPRNCDVYTADELKAIFKSELASELPIANEHEKNLVAITAMGVIDTLLAPATEKKGGAE